MPGRSRMGSAYDRLQLQSAKLAQILLLLPSLLGQRASITRTQPLRCSKESPFRSRQLTE